MDLTKLTTDIRDLRRRNRLLGLALGGTIVCELVSLFLVANIAGTDRVVVVPPSIEKTFWVTKGKASPEYLEEMAGFVAWLILDVAPTTVDWKKNHLLTYVAPDYHGAMSTQLALAADKLRRDNASTSFLLQRLESSESDQSVVLRGLLRTQINGQDTHPPELKAYLVQFKYEGGRIHLTTFKEVPHAPDKDTGKPAVPSVDISVRTQ